jgi:hypothetical protein
MGWQFYSAFISRPIGLGTSIERQSRTAAMTDTDMTQPPKDMANRAAGCVAGLLLILAVAAVIAVLTIGWIFYSLRDGLFH